MCITNDFSEKTLKAIRAYESGEKDEKSMAETLACIKTISDYFSITEKKIKADMSKNYSGQVYYFSDVEKKVYLSEGRKSTEYDIPRIARKVAPEIFQAIVTINAKKVKELDNPFVIKLVNDSKTELKGEGSITTGKMTKDELVEHRA